MVVVLLVVFTFIDLIDQIVVPIVDSVTVFDASVTVSVTLIPNEIPTVPSTGGITIGPVSAVVE